MSTPKQRLEDDLKAAMKERDAARVSTLRLLLTAVKNKAIETGEEVDEDALVGLVQRAVKQRREAATQYEKGGRDELAQKELAEAELLADYLPPQATEEELREAIAAFIAENDLSSPKDMGTVMKAMVERFGSSADRSVLSGIARELLLK